MTNAALARIGIEGALGVKAIALAGPVAPKIWNGDPIQPTLMAPAGTPPAANQFFM